MLRCSEGRVAHLCRSCARIFALSWDVCVLQTAPRAMSVRYGRAPSGQPRSPGPPANRRSRPPPRRRTVSQAGVVAEQIRSERPGRGRHQMTPAVTEPHVRRQRATRAVPAYSTSSTFGTKCSRSTPGSQRVLISIASSRPDISTAKRSMPPCPSVRIWTLRRSPHPDTGPETTPQLVGTAPRRLDGAMSLVFATAPPAVDLREFPSAGVPCCRSYSQSRTCSSDERAPALGAGRRGRADRGVLARSDARPPCLGPAGQGACRGGVVGLCSGSRSTRSVAATGAASYR